jgi:hypothetical protein
MARYHFKPAKIPVTSNLERLPLHQTIGELTIPAGSVVPGLATSDRKQDRTALSKLATKVLEDPLLLQRLSERVYELMQSDLRNQRERTRNYGGSC